jgi:hypothetical protein
LATCGIQMINLDPAIKVVGTQNNSTRKLIKNHGKENNLFSFLYTVKWERCTSFQDQAMQCRSTRFLKANIICFLVRHLINVRIHTTEKQ